MASKQALFNEMRGGAVRRLVEYAVLSLKAEDVEVSRRMVLNQLEIMRRVRAQLEDPDAETFARRTMKKAVWQCREGELDELIRGLADGSIESTVVFDDPDPEDAA